MRKAGDHAIGGDPVNTIAGIRAEMDKILEQVVWLLCPGLKDGTETLYELPAVQQRASQLLSIGCLIDHSDAAIVEAAIRWLQLAEALRQRNAGPVIPNGAATAAKPSPERPPAESLR
jgi:hypothetical protein